MEVKSFAFIRRVNLNWLPKASGHITAARPEKSSRESGDSHNQDPKANNNWCRGVFRVHNFLTVNDSKLGLRIDFGGSLWFHSAFLDFSAAGDNPLNPVLIMVLVIAAAILIVALLNSSIGHGGAPGYLALFALYGIPQIYFKPLVLALTILVALIITGRAFRSGNFRWHLFWPFMAGSIPGVFIGANFVARPLIYRGAVVSVLICCAVRLFFGVGFINEKKTNELRIWLALPAGVLMGFLSGFVGLGGAVFLSPFLLLMNWANTEEAIAAVAPFVLVNSIIAFIFSQPLLSLAFADMIYWAPAALIGGWIGSEMDLRAAFPFAEFNKALALILVLAALRVIV